MAVDVQQDRVIWASLLTKLLHHRDHLIAQALRVPIRHFDQPNIWRNARMTPNSREVDV